MLAEAIQGRLKGEPDIRMSSVREGDEVGVHSVTFNRTSRMYIESRTLSFYETDPKMIISR